LLIKGSNFVVCLSLCHLVWDASCLKLLKGIWLKFSTETEVYPGHCVSHFCSNRPRGPTSRGRKCTVGEISGHATFASVFLWNQTLRPTAQLWSQFGVEINQSPQRIIADVIGDSSLISPYFFVYI